MNLKVKEFKNGIKIDNKPFTLNDKAIEIKDFLLIKDGCLAILVEGLDGKFRIYFPYTKDKEWKDIDKKEAAWYKQNNKKPALDSLPVLDTNINAKLADRDCVGNLWVLDNDDTLFHFIDSKSFKKEKEFEFEFEDDLKDTKWTNLYIDANIPDDTYILVSITDESKEKSETYENCKNIYLYGFTGSKLSVKLLFKTDDETVSAIVYSIKAVTNKESYIEHLPAFYKGVDPSQLETLDRFLAIFQELMHDFENDVNRSHEILSPALCDKDYLPWLSSLLGLSRDYRWEEDRWRKFLLEVPSLYKGLGTKSSLKRAIELYCGEVPKINDKMKNRPYEFCVKLSSEKTKDKKDIEVIESIIWAFKPAYTVGRLFIDYGLDKNKDYIVDKSVLPFHTILK